MSEKDKKETVTSGAEVAPGRTVQGADGKMYGPGETVPLSVKEIEFLSERGFLVVAGAVVIPVANGPSFGPSEGPTVRAG